ncbi:hypothetical protein DB354_19705 [Opitutus sp. ER46]|nr:hypothetical protein DB354_19705 [Opitutus sp. ER46]
MSSAGQAAPRASAARTDRISTESAEFLRAELQRQPEVRTEVVTRAQGLAADPGYPPPEVIREVATKILASPDLSEDQS